MFITCWVHVIKFMVYVNFCLFVLFMCVCVCVCVCVCERERERD